MANPKTPTPLLPFDGDRIPQALKDIPRWAPWEAVWNEKRGKYDKIPYYAATPQFRLSTARPEKWATFDAALACLKKFPGRFQGLGLALTGQKNVVGIDLDNCVKNGVIEPWALEILKDIATYSELSPSGVGLRAFLSGTQEVDWNNHDTGIEVYGGNDARFLTITGQHLTDTPADVRDAPEGVLQALQAQYAKEKTKATVIDLNMPELLDAAELPEVADMELPPNAKDFLLDGLYRSDRSGELHAAAVSLYSTGLDHQVVFSILVHNQHAMEVALDHRRQDHDRAMHYLWREQCLKGKPKARPMVASLDDFEDVSSDMGNPISPSKPKKRRFEFQQAADYLANRKPVTWAIKNVLPRAEVGAVYGESGSGKTFLVLDMVMAIAAGTPWMGHDTQQGAVAYVCAEGASGFTTRLQAYSDHYLADLAALPVHVLGDAPSFLQVDDIRDLIASVKSIGPVAVIVVDTLAQVTAGGNENSGEDMGKALSHAKRLAAATGAMVLLVAHSGKNSDRGLRGWSGIKGALDVEIMVERSDEYRSATITKMKDGEGEGTEYPFSLTSVVLGQDESGDDITSCVIKAGNATPSKANRKPKVKGKWEKLAMQIAQSFIDLGTPATFDQLVQELVNHIPVGDGKRDQRSTVAKRTVEGLQESNHLSSDDSALNVL